MSIVRLTSLISSSVSTLLSRCSLQQFTPIISRGFKDKAVLTLRCKDCYYKKIDTRWWVLCEKHPRHKQRELVEDVKKKWIVTHRTIGHRPFQKKEEAYICNLAPPGPYDYKVNRFIHQPTTLPNKYVNLIRKTRLGQNRRLFVNIDGVEDPVNLF